MKTLSIDIETYSDVPLSKTGVYRYCESPNFEILLFGYSVDSGPVQVVDLACGEKIPEKIVAALEDETIIKWAFNASFERICLSRFLGYPTGEYLELESWRCSMIWAATMGLPLSLIACEQTGRICHTIELDEKYADVIVKRYIEQVGTSDGVSVIRDGLTYQYDEVAISEESMQA